MKNTSQRLIRVPLVLAALCALAAAALPLRAQETGPDTVYIVAKDGKTHARKGEIVEEFASKVVLKMADGKTSTIKREEISRVEYGGEPPDMRQAALASSKNDYETAAAAYKRVADDCDAGKARKLFKPQALLGRGRAFLSGGKFAEAADAFEAALKAAPTGALVREATREGVRAYIRSGNAAKALALASEAKASFKAAELPDETQDEAQLLRAEALEASGRAAEARSIFNLLTNSRDPRVKGRAALGAARAAFLSKDVDRAASQFREILAQEGVERAVRCGAARGLGDTIFLRPGAEKDFQKLRAAAAAYAEAVAVHFPARGEPTEDREAALHQGARVYDLLAAISTGEKDSKARELYDAMAQQMRGELVRLYRNSAYRAEDEQKLTKAATDQGADAPK